MPTIEDVQNFLEERGIKVLRFTRPTPTAETAAQAVGCTPAEIAKTVLLLVGGAPVAVVTSGDMKVKSSLLKQALDRTGKVRFPESEEVVRHTGYSPGGVSPFLLPQELPVLIDRSLRRFTLVYPAGGNDHSAVPISFERLMEIARGREVGVCEPVSL